MEITQLPIGLDPAELERRKLLSSLGVTKDTLNLGYPTPGLPVLQRRPEEIAPPQQNQQQSIPQNIPGAIPELQQLGDLYRTNYPAYSQYQPTTRRRVLSDIAGGAYGVIGGPYRGMQLATDISDQPYREQARRFQETIAPLQARAGIALEQQKSENEARKALAEEFERKMRGESEYIKTTPEYQMREKGYQPQTLEEAEALKKAGVRPPSPHYATSAQTGDLEVFQPGEEPKVLVPGFGETVADKMARVKEQGRQAMSRTVQAGKQAKERLDEVTRRVLSGRGVSKEADQQILHELQGNPKFGKFVQVTKGGAYFVKPPADAETNEDWKAFTTIRASKIADIQAKLTSLAGEESLDETNDEWEPVE